MATTVGRTLDLGDDDRLGRKLGKRAFAVSLACGTADSRVDRSRPPRQMVQ